MGSRVPEKRMDKNGKLVTRHVSIDNVSNSQPVTIPSPTAKQERVVLPGSETVPMTKNDMNMIGDLLDRCGGVEHRYHYLTEYIREGDLDTLRIFHQYGRDAGFSTVVDVLQATYVFYAERPEDYVESVGKHIEIAVGSSFYYADVPGYPPYEAFLNVIQENLDKTDSIIRFLSGRNPDADALKAYLGNESTPLRDGTL